MDDTLIVADKGRWASLAVQMLVKTGQSVDANQIGGWGMGRLMLISAAIGYSIADRPGRSRPDCRLFWGKSIPIYWRYVGGFLVATPFAT